MNLKKMAHPVFIMRAHRAARYGMHPIENMNLAMSRGTSIMEGNAERLVDFSVDGIEKGWHLVVTVNKRFASIVLRLEYILNSFADWIERKFG